MRLILSFLLLLLPSALSAQDDGRPVHCRMIAFGSDGDAPPVIARADSGAEVICPLPSGKISPPVICSANNNRIRFFSSADKKPLATAAIPERVRNAILVFVKAPAAPGAAQGASPWRILVIDDSLEHFPDGGMYVLNFNPSDIRFVVGEHKGMLRPGGSHGYAMPAERDSFNMAPVIFQFQKGDQWRTASESALRFLPGMRYLVFAYVDPRTGRLRVTTCQDIAPPASTAGKP